MTTSAVLSSNRILNRVIHIKDFLWKRFKPSLQTNSAFKKIFSSIFPEFIDLIDIKNIDWDRDEFSITLIEISSWEILHLAIKDNFWNKKCSWVLCANSICTWVHYEVQNEVFLKFLVYFIVKWSNLKFNDLLKILTRDLKAKKEYYQLFWKAERPPFSIIQDWWHDLHKFRFLAYEWVMRNVDQSISLNLPEASIHHSERECQWVSPNNKDTWYHFFNFPWWFYDHNFDKYYYLDEEEKNNYITGNNLWNGMWVSTDLNEEDVIMWNGTDKLSRVIDYVVENAEKNNIKVISFNCCCVPRIVWDDIYSVLKNARDKIEIPFIFQWQLEKTPYEQKILLLEKYTENIDTDDLEKKHNSISLFWYHENEYQKELGDMLSSAWIKINTSFIPSIDIRLLPLMYKSELFVFSPNNFQKEIFEHPFQSMWTRHIAPRYPYSMQYTDEWIDSILKELNVNVKENTSVIASKNIYNDHVSYVKNKKFTIWIVLIWKKEVERFLNPDCMNNIDIIYFLEEMGFRIKFFIYDNFKWHSTNRDEGYEISDGNHNDVLQIVQSKSNEIDVSFFSDNVSFEWLLADKELNLIYSDLYFDDRIINLGLNQFSLKNFYVWYSWAIHTIKGLIRLCEITFYKNYYKYFDN